MAPFDFFFRVHWLYYSNYRLIKFIRIIKHMPHTIVYQGVPGAFSHLAASAYFGPDNTFIGVQTFHSLFSKTQTTDADYGMVPVENSLAGSVVENYDLLYKHEVMAVGEYYQKIEHHLLGIAVEPVDQKGRVADLKEVLSHPKALEQCVHFFIENPHLKKVAYTDTAEAAWHVSERKDFSIAAIASSKAAELYGLAIIQDNIQDNPHNWTRFLIVTGRHHEQDILEHRKIHKCSLMFMLPHTPGSLYRALGTFANAHLNLSKIESRPIHGKPFEYIFSVDFEFHPENYAFVKNLVNEFSEMTKEIKVLGYYKKAEIGANELA
jgi:prephenate dehydratase